MKKLIGLLLVLGCLSFVGTVGCDCVDLAGPQGVQGDQGPAGPQGDQGPAGPQGQNGTDGVDGIDGFSCWDLNTNGVGDISLEDVNSDGVVDVLDCAGPQGNQGTQGDQGPVGPQGEPGPVYWSTTVTNFWNDGLFLSDLEIGASSVEQPRFGWSQCGSHRFEGSAGFTASVPNAHAYNPTAPITMRLFLYRCDDDCRHEPFLTAKTVSCEGNTDSCLVLSLLGEQLTSEGTLGGETAYLRFTPVDSTGSLLTYDIPLEALGMFTGNAEVGDFVVAELATYFSDNYYTLLGVEFFSSDSTELSAGVEIFGEAPIDCGTSGF